MSRQLDQSTYHIRVGGHLDAQWSEWFYGLTITHEKDGTTLLTGPVADQAALYGLLIRINNLGLALLSVQCMEPGSGKVGGHAA